MQKPGRGTWITLVFFLLVTAAAAQPEPRARDLGVPFDGTPGPLNAITDVKGVEVGHTTLISGSGPLKVGVGPVRTGVTAIFPRGKDSLDAVFGGWFTLNGNGEMTGTTWLEESGLLDGPVMITNTHSVGVVRDAEIAWRVKRAPPDEEGYSWSLPVVAETADDDLNDMNVLDATFGGYTVGVLVQCNYGYRRELRIAGVPVGREIPEHTVRDEDIGSIIVVVATDAPLIPTQLKRVARRVSLGLARDGSFASDGSGDIFIAFSTANPGIKGAKGLHQLTMLPNQRLNPIFLATVQATEEAIINAMVAAKTMKGINDFEVIGLPHDRLREVLKKYNRLVK